MLSAFLHSVQARVELREAHLVLRNSPPAQYLQDRDSFYAEREEYIELLFDDVIDYMDDGVREAIFALLQTPVVRYCNSRLR